MAIPPETTYSYSRVLELAGEPDENGYRLIVIDVKKGETAFHPASTKHVFYGPVRLEYLIHPMSVSCTILAGETLREEHR